MRANALLLVAAFLPPFADAQSLFPDEERFHRPRTYDVHHYKLVVSFDEKNRQVHGRTSITLTSLEGTLDSAVFDAVEMDIQSIQDSKGTPLRFRNDSTEVHVYLDSPPSTPDTVTMTISYSCSPRRGLYFIQPDSSNPTQRWQIWTQGEERENSNWFPCYDFPDDKATSEVIATVRDNYTVLSNGRLISESHNAVAKTRGFHWRQSKPHSSYLIVLAAGEYAVLQESYRDIPLLHYVYPHQVDDAPRSFWKTAAMMRFFEERIDYPYPWEKYAHIIINEFMWGGMENTSAVTLNDAFIFDARAALDFTAHDVVAHELAHQWWGDVVTCKDWTHLWLNEGFANYFEALFKRYDRGDDEFLYEARIWSRAVRQTEESLGRKPIVSTNSYGTNLYQKGAWVLRMLHDLLGDEAFWQAIRHYIRKHEFASVSTQDFIIATEEATGRELGWFFHQWVYGAGHPRLEVTSTWDVSTQELHLTVRQVQEHDSLTGLFRVPVEIEITTPTGVASQPIWITREEETFRIPTNEEPLMVVFDKGLHVLMTLNYVRTMDEHLYRLLHASDLPERLDALDALKENTDEAEVFQGIKWAAFNDKFWAVRQEATRVLSTMDFPGVKELLRGIYQDRDPRVRNAAVGALERFRTSDVASFIENVAHTDSSYSVLATCIRTMAKVDSSRVYDFASRFVDMDSYRDMIRRTSLGALRTSKDPRALALARSYTLPGHHTSTRTAAIAVLRELGEHEPSAREYLARLVNDGNTSVRTAAIRTLGDWSGSDLMEILSRRQSIEKDKSVRQVLEGILGATDAGHDADVQKQAR